jgi:hypothetical protein
MTEPRLTAAMPRSTYIKFGFAPLLDDSRHLFLALPTIRKLGLAQQGRDTHGT